MVECLYAGELVHTLVIPDAEMARLHAEPKRVRWAMLDALKQARPDLDLPDAAQFDYVIRMGGR